MIEWLRSCYRSSWRLFQGHPEITTKGRYVFAPLGTPHYADFHNLGSRNWVSDERVPLPSLGETEGKQQWTNGAPPAGIPAAALLGSADCIANGETWPLPLIVRNLDTGFDSRCPMLTHPEPNPPVPAPVVIDGTNCHDQRQFTAVLVDQYDTGNGTAAILARWPTAVVTNVPNSDSSIPGTTIAIVGDTTLVIVSGTTNFQQWALQAVGGVQAPTNQGPYGTVPLWQRASDAIVRRIDAAGGSTTGRIIFVGHSYGGAVACILAYRYSRVTRDVQLVTFGSPKPGDSRLIDGLNRTTQRHFVNDDDPVPFLPPSARELGLASGLINLQVRQLWGEWEQPRNRIGLSTTAQRTDNPDSGDVFALLVRSVIGLVTTGHVEAFTAHYASEYRRRVLCPADPVPSPTPGAMPALWFQPESLETMAIGTVVSVWPDTSINGRDGLNRSTVQPVVWANDVDGRMGATSTNIRNLTLAKPLTLTGDFAAYLVCSVPSDFDSASNNVALGTNASGQYLIRIAASSISWKVGFAIRTMATTPNYDTIGLFSARRVGNVLTLRKNGDTQTFAVPLPSNVNVVLPLPQHTPGPFHGVPALTYEVKVFDSSVSDAEDASEVARLLAKFGL